MALSDTKKVQTMINVCGYQMITIRDAVNTMKTIRTLFQTINPNVTGTPLEGNVTALNNALNALDTEVQKAIWTGLINAIVPSHEGRALDG